MCILTSADRMRAAASRVIHILLVGHLELTSEKGNWGMGYIFLAKRWYSQRMENHATLSNVSTLATIVWVALEQTLGHNGR